MASPEVPPCCPHGSWPQLVTSKDEPPTPKGSVFAIKMDNGQDLQVYYVSGGSKGGIVVFQDIFSIRVFAPESKSTDRTVAICDTLADAGYSVVLPDLFGKEPFDFCTPLPDESKGEDFINRNAFGLEGAPEWFGTKTGYYNHKPTVIAAVDYLVDKIGKDAPLGCLGFCFGNWLMSKAQFEGDAKFTCGVGCHPSTALENMHGGDEVAMLQGVKAPWLFLAAGNDSEIFKSKDGAGRAALEAVGGGVIDFDDMLHGWVSRGDASKENVARDVEKAMNDILDFFEKKMKF